MPWVPLVASVVRSCAASLRRCWAAQHIPTESCCDLAKLNRRKGGKGFGDGIVGGLGRGFFERMAEMTLICFCNHLPTAKLHLPSTWTYMRYLQGQEGKGIGLSNKLRTYVLQDTEGLDEKEANLRLGFPPDKRKYQAATTALEFLGVESVVLYTGKCLVRTKTLPIFLNGRR